MFGNNRDQLRRYYGAVWQKAKRGELLEPLEQIIATTLRAHPEYQPLMVAIESALDREYLPDQGQTNPFLHLGMHIAIQEQLHSDHPVGMVAIYQRLCRRLGDSHAAEHTMMDCLGEILWEAQRNGQAPDEQAYLQRLRRLARL
ncbi:MAG: DUF1841 family protein [Candidatus Contendobacter sp.]